MKVLSWLRRIVADFLRGDREDTEVAAGQIERELAGARAVAALAVAQARRAELELREALETDPGNAAQLTRLAALLEEARDRARMQVAAFHQRRARAAEALERSGEAAQAARLNRDRESLRVFADRAAAVSDRDALDDMEDRIRAEAAALDVLDALDGGQPLATEARHAQTQTDDAAARARRLLARDAETWM